MWRHASDFSTVVLWTRTGGSLYALRRKPRTAAALLQEFTVNSINVRVLPWDGDVKRVSDGSSLLGVVIWHNNDVIKMVLGSFSSLQVVVLLVSLWPMHRRCDCAVLTVCWRSILSYTYICRGVTEKIVVCYVSVPRTGCSWVQVAFV